MSFKKNTDWTSISAPIEVSEQLRESSKCPVCGKSYFDVLKMKLEEYQKGFSFGETGFEITEDIPLLIPPAIKIWCDNEDCKACDEDFLVNLSVFIFPCY